METTLVRQHLRLFATKKCSEAAVQRDTGREKCKEGKQRATFLNLRGILPLLARRRSHASLPKVSKTEDAEIDARCSALVAIDVQIVHVIPLPKKDTEAANGMAHVP